MTWRMATRIVKILCVPNLWLRVSVWHDVNVCKQGVLSALSDQVRGISAGVMWMFSLFRWAAASSRKWCTVSKEMTHHELGRNPLTCASASAVSADSLVRRGFPESEIRRRPNHSMYQESLGCRTKSTANRSVRASPGETSVEFLLFCSR